jgi:NADP-dependent 3-hydroxy acid dehydrogenase YdfG
MADDFLKNPLSLFDVKDKVAIITGASGAFGALAARVLSAAGCKLVLTAGKRAELDAITAECAGAVGVNIRP